MVWALGVGGPRLDVAGGGWDAWPIVGLVVALWLGRRVFALPWRAPLLVGAIGGSLVLPVCVNAWGVVPTTAAVLVITVLLRIGRVGGAAKRNHAV